MCKGGYIDEGVFASRTDRAWRAGVSCARICCDAGLMRGTGRGAAGGGGRGAAGRVQCAQRPPLSSGFAKPSPGSAIARGRMYRPARDWARVCGVACEDADQAAAVGAALDPLTAVVLNPDTAQSIRVDRHVEPRLPALRRWASAAKDQAPPFARSAEASGRAGQGRRGVGGQEWCGPSTEEAGHHLSGGGSFRFSLNQSSTKP